MASVHYRTCPLCEAMCGLRVETEGTSITSIRGDADDPLSRGYVCPKAPALQAIHEDPDRIRRPLIRRGDDFVEADWDTALSAAADGLHRVQGMHGRNAVGVYVGNPTVHNLGAQLFMPLLLRTLRTRNVFSATSVDQLPHQLVAHYMFGHQFLIPIPDLERTQHLVILGANPLASNGSLMSAPDMRGRLKAIRKRGGKVVVVDPRRTETARAADEHHFIQPGTDAWLLGAMLRVALDRGRGLGRLAEHTEHLEELRRAVEPITPARASGPTGLSAQAIEQLATELCETPKAICYGRMGTSTQAFGAVCNWMINALNLVTGNFDQEGGVLFTAPAVDAVDAPKGFGISPGKRGRWRSRVRGLPEFSGELPVAALAEEMLTEGDGQIRALFTSAGNPVLSTPNGGQLDRALSGLDFQVAVDFYRNETTRHADVILPPTSPLERSHYDVAFHHLAVRNTAKFSEPVFAAPDGAKHDWEIFVGLSERLDQLRGESTLQRKASIAAMRRLGPEGLVDLGLRRGPYGVRGWPPRLGLSLAKLRKEKHGVDLGPLQPSLPKRMQRFRERIDLAPEPLVEDLDRLFATESEERSALRLIGRRHLRSNNSWMHNAPKLVAGKPICTLMMHPSDAGRHRVEDGEMVAVRSRVGRIEVPVEVTEDILEGVVSLPHGFGHDRPGVRLAVAQSQAAGASINDLTDETLLDHASGNAQLSGFPVVVEKKAAAAE